MHFCRPCSHLFRSTLALRRSAHSRHDLFRLPSRSTLKPQAWNFFLQLVHLMASLTCSGSDAAAMFISFYIRVCLSNWSGRRGGRLPNCLRWCLLAMCVHVARFFCGRFHLYFRLGLGGYPTHREGTRKCKIRAKNGSGGRKHRREQDGGNGWAEGLTRWRRTLRLVLFHMGPRWGEWMQWRGSVVGGGGGAVFFQL
jgi:hypothetical protein